MSEIMSIIMSCLLSRILIAINFMWIVGLINLLSQSSFPKCPLCLFLSWSPQSHWCHSRISFKYQRDREGSESGLNPPTYHLTSQEHINYIHAKKTLKKIQQKKQVHWKTNKWAFMQILQNVLWRQMWPQGHRGLDLLQNVGHGSMRAVVKTMGSCMMRAMFAGGVFRRV